MGRHGEGAKGGARLYVVATPIGNLGDVTQRALETLRSVDTVFAEDTRHATGLLAHHGIRTQLAALHEHNERAAARTVCRLLAAGRDVALVSDAGTPAISDPGAITVAAARAAGFAVVPVPGASAAVAALSVAGMPGPYAFVGFLPAKSAARRNALGAWRAFAHTLVFYEAPHRILACVDDLAAVLGAERIAVLARELTKVFETVHACRLGDARAWLEADPDRQRGEFVVVVSGATADAPAARAEEGERVLRLLLRELPVNRAARLVAEITGARKNALYAKALEIQGPSRRSQRTQRAQRARK
ncbi:MAG TPA: 16S rRNA (cytidine(1402)-2'-O)-methyltransferase [Burkholderiales bacterium]|nr:16S rRNA (cytidine(1402)-2'-O)-methyltransferase [Burkholderiales bacterium]